MLVLLIALAGASTWAQDTSPVRTLKGQLLDWRIQGLAGDLALRTEDRAITRCQVRWQSQLMRAGLRIHPHGVRIGDWVELTGDFDGNGGCVVRTLSIRAFEHERRRPPDVPMLPMYARGYLDWLWMRGTLTFSGVVRSLEDQRLILRTRKSGVRSFAVREDTVFREGGRAVDSSALEPFTRVFVRGSRTYDGDIEAYHVIWGNILIPNR
jgi:hypothetical protein